MRGIVESAGNRIAYGLDGPPGAPVLVLSASLGTTRALWDGQLPVLAGHLRVLTYDHRGHGGSAAPPGPYAIPDLATDVIDLLDALDIARASLCGISIGGAIALEAARRWPERVNRLVLACTALTLGAAGGWRDRAAAVRAGGSAAILGTILPRWFDDDFRARHPETAAAAAAMLAGCDAEGYALCCEALATLDEAAPGAPPAAPTLVLAGADDVVIRPGAALELAAAIPGASLTVLAGAGHLANLSQPERFTAAVLDHVLGPAAERGESVRRAVLGDAHVDRAAGRAASFSAPFQRFITEYAWGGVWARPGLGRRERSVATLAILVALGRMEELAFHVPAALRNGLDPDEIREVLLHTAVYAGVPAANSAMAVAERALRECGAKPRRPPDDIS